MNNEENEPQRAQRELKVENVKCKLVVSLRNGILILARNTRVGGHKLTRVGTNLLGREKAEKKMARDFTD